MFPILADGLRILGVGNEDFRHKGHIPAPAGGAGEVNKGKQNP